mgnify:CR=1 FL=1
MHKTCAALLRNRRRDFVCEEEDVCVAVQRVLATLSGVPQSGMYASAETIDTAAMAEEAAVLLNTFRQENGLDTLKVAPILSELSGIRAKELMGCYGHTRPDGADWFTVVEESELDSNC